MTSPQSALSETSLKNVSGLPPKGSTQLRLRHSCVRHTKKASRVLLHTAGAVRSQGLLCCCGIWFGASGADDLISGAEDFWALFSGITHILSVTQRPWSRPFWQYCSIIRTPLQTSIVTDNRLNTFRAFALCAAMRFAPWTREMSVLTRTWE